VIAVAGAVAADVTGYAMAPLFDGAELERI